VDGNLAATRLVDLFPTHATTATTFDTAAWLVYPSRTYLPGKVRATIDFLKMEFAGSAGLRVREHEQG
jgi:DNA-binding transcriptional LysR family regulator